MVAATNSAARMNSRLDINLSRHWKSAKLSSSCGKGIIWNIEKTSKILAS